jgi:hypothetical protein
MSPAVAANSDLLKCIARRAMLEHGLLADFSAAALNQARSIAGTATAS